MENSSGEKILSLSDSFFRRQYKKGVLNMDIARLSIAMSQNSVKNQVSTALLKISMDSNSEVMSNITEMMGNVATNPNVGTTLDVRA